MSVQMFGRVCRFFFTVIIRGINSVNTRCKQDFFSVQMLKDDLMVVPVSFVISRNVSACLSERIKALTALNFPAISDIDGKPAGTEAVLQRFFESLKNSVPLKR